MPNNRTPKVKVTELVEDRICFELTETDVSMANALRRIMISEVPTLCIDMVTFSENTSVLADEFIAHRLGLIPLRSLTKDMSQWNYNHSCDCGELACQNCSVSFTLDCDFETLCEQDRSADNFKVNVTTRDLISANPDVVPAHFSNEAEEENTQDTGGITILTLGRGQKISLTATAKKGIGKEHSKWSPVSTCALKHDAIVKLNDEVLNDYSEEQRRRIVGSCPREVFEYDEGSSQVLVKDASACIFCKECVFLAEDFRKTPEDPLGVEVKHSPDKFFFTVETTGALKPVDVVRDAIRQLAEKIRHLKVKTIKLESM